MAKLIYENEETKQIQENLKKHVMTIIEDEQCMIRNIEYIDMEPDGSPISVKIEIRDYRE